MWICASTPPANLGQDRNISTSGVLALFKDKKRTAFANKHPCVLANKRSIRVNRVLELRCWLEHVRRVIGRPYKRSKWSLSSTSNDNLCIPALDSFGPFNERMGTACSFGDKGSSASFYAK